MITHSEDKTELLIEPGRKRNYLQVMPTQFPLHCYKPDRFFKFVAAICRTYVLELNMYFPEHVRQFYLHIYIDRYTHAYMQTHVHISGLNPEIKSISLSISFAELFCTFQGNHLPCSSMVLNHMHQNYWRGLLIIQISETLLDLLKNYLQG